jgi:hypothetical protein
MVGGDHDQGCKVRKVVLPSLRTTGTREVIYLKWVGGVSHDALRPTRNQGITLRNQKKAYPSLGLQGEVSNFIKWRGRSPYYPPKVRVH